MTSGTHALILAQSAFEAVCKERDEMREQLQAMREVIAAAEKCRHWHDCSYNEDTGKTEGVIISAESFWSLQNALTKLQTLLP